MRQVGCCGRCGVAVADGEVCWWCGGSLCGACWEVAGHSGRPKAPPSGHPDHQRILA